jgi:hypothetical protein
MGRIVEVEKSVYSLHKDGMEVLTGEVEYIVKNDWHCGYMASDDIDGYDDVIYGSIFQRMPTSNCASFYNGEISESCRYCKGIYNMKEMHAVEIDGDMFVCFCDHDYSPSHKEFKKYLKDVDIAKNKM